MSGDGLDGLFDELASDDDTAQVATDRDDVLQALSVDHGLRSADIDFLESAADRLALDEHGSPTGPGRALSTDQRSWLDDILDRIA